MSYYGESECLCKRYAQHLIELQNGTHYNKSLLQSYQEQNNLDGLKFFVLDWGTADKTLRLKHQDEYILANKIVVIIQHISRKNDRFVQFKLKIKLIVSQYWR